MKRSSHQFVKTKPSRPANSLASSARLRKKIDISRCQEEGRKLHAKHFLILVLASESGESRLAVAVTTKLEKSSVRRNLIKRRIREVFRVARKDIKTPIDIVVVARRGVQLCSFSDYQREILGALRSNGFLRSVEPRD